jgi:hypothetical protein
MEKKKDRKYLLPCRFLWSKLQIFNISLTISTSFGLSVTQNPPLASPKADSGFRP